METATVITASLPASFTSVTTAAFIYTLLMLPNGCCGSIFSFNKDGRTVYLSPLFISKGRTDGTVLCSLSGALFIRVLYIII